MCVHVCVSRGKRENPGKRSEPLPAGKIGLLLTAWSHRYASLGAARGVLNRVTELGADTGAGAGDVAAARARGWGASQKLVGSQWRGWTSCGGGRIGEGREGGKED